MESNPFHKTRNESTSPNLTRERWLDDLQRRFSADMNRQSEILYNCSAHVDGCSSESDDDLPTRRGNQSSFATSCSGAVKRLTKDEQIDNLTRIVKLHDQQINLLQSQIKYLVDVIHNVCGSDVKDDSSTTNNVSIPADFRRRIVDDSDLTPKCVAEISNPNFFSTVMGTLRGILDEADSDIGSRDSSANDKLLDATVEQLKNLGVSYIERPEPLNKKQVTFCDDETVRNESSVEIDSLARKYLLSSGDAKEMNEALDKIQGFQKRSTDLSLATVKYLKRYKLSRGDEKKKTTDDDYNIVDRRIDNILDSTAIRSQPKLAPKKQWLLRKN